jgi:hypothetical protein
MDFTQENEGNEAAMGCVILRGLERLFWLQHP